MDKIKAAFTAIAAGYERAVDFITEHPKVTFWLIVGVIVVGVRLAF